MAKCDICGKGVTFGIKVLLALLMNTKKIQRTFVIMV